ncbi:hypothetical protein [Cellulomonas sp. URHB0016]
MRTTVRRSLALLGASTLVVAGAGAAQASVTLDAASGAGFVGKGDVQTALGWNNAVLQKNAESLTFTSRQAAAQSVTQGVSQTGQQLASQTVSQDVTCTLVTGKKSFHRDGERAGVSDGTRAGTRAGSRAGALSGVLASDVAYEARKANQFTGFNLKGYAAGPSFTASGDVSWGAASYGDWSFGDYTFGEVVWGGWEAEPGENPADCLGGNPGVTDLTNDLVAHDPVAGLLLEGPASYGTPAYGAVAATGPVALFVNSVPLPITPAVVG